MTGNPQHPVEGQLPKAPLREGSKASVFQPASWKRLLLRPDSLLFLLSIALFLFWPDIDLAVSQWFYDAQRGFEWRNDPTVLAIYQGTSVLGLLALLVPLAMLLAKCVWKHHCLIPRRRVCVYLLAVALVGPGILVNLTLKQHWERPRPRQVVEFGGERQYEPPFAPRFECSKCRSFVSGHASVGFFFFSVALLLGNRRWLWLPILGGGIIGLVRMLQGAHFLSDVIFSGWVVWFCSLLIYSLFFGRSSCGQAVAEGKDGSDSAAVDGSGRVT